MRYITLFNYYNKVRDGDPVAYKSAVYREVKSFLKNSKIFVIIIIENETGYNELL